MSKFDIEYAEDEIDLGGEHEADVRAEIKKLAGGDDKAPKKKADKAEAEEDDAEIVFTDDEELPGDADGADEDDDGLDVDPIEDEEKAKDKLTDAAALRRELEALKRERQEEKLAAITEREETAKQTREQIIEAYKLHSAKVQQAAAELDQQKAARRAAMVAGDLATAATHEEYIDKLEAVIAKRTQTIGTLERDFVGVETKLKEYEEVKKKLSAKRSPAAQKFIDDFTWFNPNKDASDLDEKSARVHKRAAELAAKGITGDHLFTVLRRNITQWGLEKKKPSASSARGVSASSGSGGSSGGTKQKIMITPGIKKAIEAAGIELTDKAAVKTFVSTLVNSKHFVRKGN